MTQTRPLRPGTPQEIDAALQALSRQLVDLSDQVEHYPARSDETVAVAAILRRCSRDVDKLREAVPLRADLAAWCMRNLFELWVIFSSIIRSNEKMKRWMGQTIADEIQVLEAARMWVADYPHRSQSLEAGLAHLKGICERFGLKPDERQFNIEALSKELQREAEYKVMYKLSSKFVHPSAALVNGRLGSEDDEYTNMFLIRGQEYALQLFSEAKAWFHLWSVPAQGGTV